MTDFISLKQLLYSKKMLWTIIALGIIFRIVPYFANCSL